MPLSAGTKLGPYEIVAPLGAGGMGEVYRARDSKLQRDVALKVLPDEFAGDPDRMARFRREAELLASLNHPHIAQIYAVEETALVMELVEGEMLKGPLPLDEALRIAAQIADALEAAHEKGIVHRDLKPPNIMITAAGVVKVLDFGLAAVIQGPTSTATDPTHSPTLTLRATQAGMILGTAAYMAPEQARGKPVDKRADIWAFGVVLYEMLMGKRLFDGETISDTLAAVLKTEPDLTQVPPQAQRLLRLCLEKDPKRRLRDIGDFRILCQEPPPKEEPAAPLRSAPVWMGVSGLLLLVLAGLALVHFREAPPAGQVLRFSIPIPENSSVGHLVLSPDGRNLVIGIGSGGKSQLWLRALDSPQLRPLSGTDTARTPFWSPDSRSIGFIADGKLKTIPASGGPVQVLCDAGLVGGGAWNRDGVILFSTSSGSLQRVEAAGGECTPVTKPEMGTFHMYPVFLPDGKHFLYDVLGGEEAKKGVYLGALDNPTGRRILTDVSSVVFVPPTSGVGHGHILFLRETSLMAQPFDAGTFQLAGDVFPVAEQASTSISPPQAAASASPNGVLVYLANSPRDSELTWFDRSGKEQAKVVAHSGLFAVSLSPDEKTVAFDRRSGIWLHELIRSVETQFTFPPIRGGSPVWSPDGGHIAFAAHGGVYRKDASGGGQEELLLPILLPKGVSPSDWSRDGRFLLYTENDPKTLGDLWILPDPLGKSAGAPIPFLRTEFIESQGQFSPDGRWIAYVSNETGQFEVYVRPFPAGAGKWKVSTNGGYEPRWRRDGKELFYLQPDGLMRRLMVVGIQPGSSPVFKLGAPKPLFAVRLRTFVPQGNAFPYSVAADGQRFLMNTQVSTAEPSLNVIVNWEKAASGKER